MRRVVICLTAFALLRAAALAQAPPHADRATSLDASRITIDVTDAPLWKVVRMFAEQSDNPPFSVQEAYQRKKVTLSVKDMSYWQAVEKFCEATGFDWGHCNSRGELRLRKAKGRRRIVTHAGPVILYVYHIRRRHAFRPFGVDKRLRHYAMYSVYYLWESRLPVISSETWGTKIETLDGTDLIDNYATKGPRRFGYNYGDKSPPRSPGGFTVYIGSPPKEARKLAAIEGFLLFEFGKGENTLKIDDVQGAKPEFVTADGLSLRVDKTWWVGDSSLVTTLTLRVRHGTAWPPVHAVSSSWGFFLVDPDGKRYPATPTTPVPTLKDRMELLGEANSGGGDDGTASEFQISFRFYRLPQDVKLWSLVCVYPETYRLGKYPFKFKDVPLR